MLSSVRRRVPSAIHRHAAVASTAFRCMPTRVMTMMMRAGAAAAASASPFDVLAPQQQQQQQLLQHRAYASSPVSSFSGSHPLDTPTKEYETQLQALDRDFSRFQKLTNFNGRVVMIGCGSIGQGVLPLLLSHFRVSPDRITILSALEDGREVAERYGVEYVVGALTRDNYVDMLSGKGPSKNLNLQPGDFLCNLSVDVGSVDMMELASQKGALYIDTVVEPWAGPGGYTDPSLPAYARTNNALRDSCLARKKLASGQPGAPTAVSAHGANPGLVSHFVKQALVNIARDTALPDFEEPTSRSAWAELAQRLGIKVIHIAERDTQRSDKSREPGEFVNTWSIDGFVSEGCQPAELGYGTHEKSLPFDGMKFPEEYCQAGIYLLRPGASTRVRTWTPLEGHFHGFLITHNESISIADYLTARSDSGEVQYRPTVHYAYHPCDDAVVSVHELCGKNMIQQESQRLLMDEIVSGVDELGVLLAGHSKNAYWFGSQLSIEETRRIVPYNNATSLQVAAAVLAGMVYAVENPALGIVEADEVDYKRALEVCRPYLGPLVGEYSDWTPLHERGVLFEEEVDKEDPWQFKNVIVR